LIQGLPAEPRISTMHIHLSIAPSARLVATAAIALAAALAGPAQASLVSPVTSISLLAPGGMLVNTVPNTLDVTPIALVDSNVSTAIGLSVGDGSNIGSFMLGGESISFSGNSIFLNVAAGVHKDNGDLVTGLLGSGGEHARYVFDGLEVAGETIIGADIVVLSGVVGGGSGGLTAPGQVSFNMDDLKFAYLPNGSDAGMGFFRIDLVLQGNNGGGNVPEPASWALTLVALAALRGLSRRHQA
jgi:MYXO-CTERM domain-containing protein